MDDNDIGFNMIVLMQTVLDDINKTKVENKANGYDPRALAVAATNLETAMLWVANARPEPEV
jgi:hypothetical protein